MKKLIIILVVLAVAAGGYFAYNKYFSSDDLVKSIPQDAVFVGAFDLTSIVEKAGGKELNDMKMMQRLREELAKDNEPVSKVVLGLMDDPMKTGINFLKRVYFFVDRKDDNEIVGFTCGLLSSEDFEAMMKKFPMTDTVKQNGEFKSMNFEGHALFTWNEKQLIILGSNKQAPLGDYMKSLFDHPSPNITTANGFHDFNSSKFDMGMFMNYSSLFDFTRMMHWPASAAVPTDFYKGMHAGAFTEFNDNSVQTKMKYYFSDSKMSENMMIMNETGISSDQAKMVTTKNVLGLFSFSINPEKVIGLFEKEALYSGIFTEIEKQVGLKKDDLKNLTNGEITLALVDVKNEVVTRQRPVFDPTNGMTYRDVQDTTLMPVFTASMGIKDRKVFDKLMQGTGLQKQGPYYVINAPGLQIYLVDNKTGITITNDQAIADELVQKKELADMPEPAKSLATKNGCAFYFDLNLQHYPQQVSDMMHTMMGPDGYPAFQKTMALFEDVEAAADRNSALFDLKLVNGTGNSLHRIVDAIDKNVYTYIAEQEAKSKQMMEEYQTTMQHQMDSMAAAGAYRNK